MEETLFRGEGANVLHPVRARWRPTSYVWALAVGIALIGALTAYVIHRDYRTTLTLWNSRLSGAVIGRTWILRNSLQESQDDTRVLADFASTRELLISGRDGSGVPVPRAALLEQVVGLFDEYRRVYEYAAVCLLDPEGRVVVEATDSTAWAGVIQSAQFKELIPAGTSRRHYAVKTLQTSSGARTLIFMIPVFISAAVNKLGSGPISPLGTVVILDPLARELVPLLEAESNFARTGEALLLWLQGDEGGYASPRRYLWAGSADRVSSSDTLKRAVASAVEDQAVFGEFLDYRGVAVIAAMQKIPSLEGVVVYKVDREEAFTDFHRKLRLQIFAAAALLVVYVGILLWLRRSAGSREMKERIAQQQAVLAERLRAEASLRTLNETLETKVTERTTLLAKANEQLRRELDERERAERALQASEERYRELIENAGDIIYTHDLEGRFTWLNRAGERCIGSAREEILATNIREIVVAEYRDLLQQMTCPLLRDQDARTYELEMISKQGKRLFWEIRPRIIMEDGKPIGVQGIARDLTERKRLEQELRQAQKMEAVGRLAGGIAHDFNNLLTIILGYGEVVSNQLPHDGLLRQQVTEIMNAGKRAAALTAQLLTFSRRQLVNPEVLNMNLVASDMDSMLRRAIGEDINLTTKPEVGLGCVKADRGQMEQVILNLAINARDAMTAGGSLTIELASVDGGKTGAPPQVPVKPGRYVMLKVSDTGHGMDAVTQAHIFEPFFTTKGPGKGTGLGLAMVYGIVEQAGGYVWVDSAPGRGSTFKILLPQVDGAVPAEFNPDLAPAEISAGNETILLVEDEENVRVFVREILERSGYKVLEARQGDEGLQIGEGTREPIHLLVTDVIMPQMGGPELARRITSSHPETRVLFISGYADGALNEDHVVPEYAALLLKPFTPDAFMRKVREVLERDANVDGAVRNA
jgi:two-component system, cell cycle sensor histidine kinase and response regulator CckA